MPWESLVIFRGQEVKTVMFLEPKKDKTLPCHKASMKPLMGVSNHERQLDKTGEHFEAGSIVCENCTNE